MFVKITVCVSYIYDLQVKIKFLLFKIKIYPLEAKVEKRIKTKKLKKQKVVEKQKPPKPKPPIKEVLLLLKELIIEIYSKFGKYIKIEEYRVRVLVATDDPAKTGVLYGVVCAIMGNISVFINQIKRRTRREGKILTEVTPDFLAEEPELFVSVALSMRIWQLMLLGITASKGFLKYISLSKEEKVKQHLFYGKDLKKNE